MTKKETKERERAYNLYKDDKRFIKKDGTYKVFDIESAVLAYRKEHTKKKPKQQEQVQYVKPDIKYNYNLNKLFDEGYDNIDYIALEDEWRHRNSIAREYGNYTALFLKLWFNAYIEYNNIEIIKEKIIYNDRHYAIRNDSLLENDGLILKSSDFIRYTANGIYRYNRNGGADDSLNKTRTGTTYKDMDELIKRYYYFFNEIGIKDVDQMFIHILYLLFKTTDLDSWIYGTYKDGHNYFSPMRLKDTIVRLNESGFGKLEKFKDSNKHRFQKLFVEPGYEKEGKENYLEDRNNALIDKIKLATKKINESGGTLNNLNVYNETIKMVNLTYRKFIKIVNENGINIGEKIQFKMVETEIEDINVKALVKTERKQQERSLWHKLVEEGASYEEVIEKFPEVKSNAYRTFKNRLKKVKIVNEEPYKEKLEDQISLPDQRQFPDINEIFHKKTDPKFIIKF